MISSSVQRSNFCTSAAAQTQQGIVVATAKERKSSQAPASWKDVFFLTFKPDFRSAPIILSKPSLDFWWSKMSIGRPKKWSSKKMSPSTGGHVSAPPVDTNGSCGSSRAKASGRRKSGATEVQGSEVNICRLSRMKTCRRVRNLQHMELHICVNTWQPWRPNVFNLAFKRCVLDRRGPLTALKTWEAKPKPQVTKFLLQSAHGHLFSRAEPS